MVRRRNLLIGAASAAIIRPRRSLAQMMSGGAIGVISGAYPSIATPGAGIITGMVGAYFPGYGAPVHDLTGTWNSLTAQTWGTLGALQSNASGKAMFFNGLLNGVWASGAGMPLATATQFSLAHVSEALWQGHAFGCCMAISQSNLASSRINMGLYRDSAPLSDGQWVANGQTGLNSIGCQSNLFTFPQAVSVIIGVFDFTVPSASLYVNGTLVPTNLISGSLSLTGFDTVSIGCRVNTQPATNGFNFTSGQNTGTAASIEDTIIGCPLTDTAAVLPANTYVTNYNFYSNPTILTLSAAATGNATNDTISGNGPLTRLQNSRVNACFLWNRLLTGGEISSFSASPFAAFTLP